MIIKSFIKRLSVASGFYLHEIEHYCAETHR
jgi:hypothetical protein